MSELDDAVMYEVLRYIGVPRTVEEVAENWEWHPQTARRYLWALERMGKARTLPRKQGRKKLWQAAGGATLSGEVQLVTSIGPVSLGALAQWSESAFPSGNLIGGSLAYIWRRVYYRQFQGTLDERLMGSLEIRLQVLKFLQAVVTQLRRQLEATEQLILGYDELWNEADVVLQMFGPVDAERRAVLEDAAAKIEPIIRDWWNQQYGSQSPPRSTEAE